MTWIGYVATTYLLIGLIATLAPPIRSLITLEVESISGPKARLVAFRGILMIAAVLGWPLVWIVARAKTRARSVWNTLEANPEFQKQQELFEAMGKLCDETGVDFDELPGATGDFGVTPTNPIPTRTVFGTISYLAHLRTIEGMKVRYERFGSLPTELSPFPIDRYEILDSNGRRLETLYFSPYQKRNSKRVPRGFLQA